MSNTEQPTVKNGFSWWKIIFALSLSLNLLVLGLVGGAVLGHARDRDEAPALSSELRSFGPYARALSREDRAVLGEAMKSHSAWLRENRLAVRGGFKEVLAALRARPYDPDAAAAVLQTQQARVRGQNELIGDLFLDRINTMSLQERAAFADRLEKALRRGPPRHDENPSR